MDRCEHLCCLSVSEYAAGTAFLTSLPSPLSASVHILISPPSLGLFVPLLKLSPLTLLVWSENLS